VVVHFLSYCREMTIGQDSLYLAFEICGAWLAEGLEGVIGPDQGNVHAE